VFLTHHPRPGGGACTKLTLTTTAILLAVGAPAWVCSRGNDRTIGHLNPAEKAFHALFASAAMRSGGFAHRHERVHPITLLVSDALMFVGGGSASTAGGIKVATLAVLFLGIIAEARGDRHVIAAGRHIPDGSLRLAISVTFLGATPVLVATGAGDDRQHRAAGPILFEVISAFATCGLSVGLSAELEPFGKYVLSLLMLAGRIGPIGLAAALALRQRNLLYTSPRNAPSSAEPRRPCRG
jgi:Trk-type K+ transport system membrane component